MQFFELTFIEHLKQQILEQLYNSIYMQIATRSAETIDLSQLGKSTCSELLTQLLNQVNVEYSIDCSDAETHQSKLSELCRFANQSTATARTNASNTVAIGFPVLQLKDLHNETLKFQAPLLIWQVRISKNTAAGDNNFTINRTASDPIVINPVLEYYIEKNYQLPVESLYNYLIDDYLLDSKELSSWLVRVMQAFDNSTLESIQSELKHCQNNGLRPIKTKEQQIFQTTKGQLLMAAVIGCFESANVDLVKNYDALIDRYTNYEQVLITPLSSESNHKSSFMKHPFAFNKNLLYQQLILNKLYKGKSLLYKNLTNNEPPLLYTDIIANALSNAGTCMLVSNNNSTLEIVEKELHDLGLDKLVVRLDKNGLNRKKLIAELSENTQKNQPAYQVAPTFIQALKNCLTYYHKMQAFYQKMAPAICGTDNWTNLVGKWLELTPVKDNPLLKVLNNHAFQFNLTEYESIMQLLARGSALFEPLGTLQHPLNALNNRFFKAANVTVVEKEIRNSLEKIHKVVKAAQQDILAYLFDYEQLLEQYFSDIYLKKTTQADKIIDSIEIGLKNSKYYFSKNSGMYRKLLSKVNSKYEELEKDKKAVLLAYYELQQMNRRMAYVDFRFKNFNDPEKQDFEQLMQHVNDYKIAVYDWYAERNMAIQEHVRDLSPNNSYRGVSFDRQVRQLSRNLDHFEEQFCNSAVFKVQFQFVTKNIRKRLTQIERLDENLTKMKENFDNFKDYHALKFFTSDLNKAQYEAFVGLCSCNPDDWKRTFSDWYFQTMLYHHQDATIPDRKTFEQDYSFFNQALIHFKTLLPQHTLRYWQGKQTQEITKFHKKNKAFQLHQLYKGPYSLKQTIQHSLEVFQSLYPIILIDSASIESLIPMQARCFDLVIFDQSYQLQLSELYPTLLRSKYSIVAGDPKQLNNLKNAPKQDVVDYLLETKHKGALLSNANQLSNLYQFCQQYDSFDRSLVDDTKNTVTATHISNANPPNNSAIDQFQKLLKSCLCNYFPGLHFVENYPFKGFFLPLVALNNQEKTPLVVFNIDLWLRPKDNNWVWMNYLMRQLEAASIKYVQIWSKEWLDNHERAKVVLKKKVESIISDSEK